jgi:heptosyltransferase-2
MRFSKSVVVLKSYLGDTVMASPLVRSVAGESSQTIVSGPPIVEQLLRFKEFKAEFSDPGKLSNPFQLFAAARAVRRMRPDVGFLVNRSFRSALFLRLTGVPLRIGHDTEGRGRLLTHRVPYDEDRNEAECYLDLARAIGLDPRFTQPQLEPTLQEVEEGGQLLQGATMGIQPGARHDYKQVPVAVWREFGSSLISRGQRLAFFGGKEEQDLVGEIGLAGVDLIGATTIRQTIGALANLKLMIGGDTGVMHMAASVGTPTVTAFGPTPFKKWGWFQAPHQVVVAPDRDISKLDAEALIEAAEKALCGSR